MEGLLTFTTVVLLGLAVYNVQNLIRYARTADWNGVLGILLALAGGWAIASLGAHAEVTANMQLIQGAPPLGQLDGGSLVLLGVGIGSVAPGIADFFKSRDNADSAAKPKLIPSVSDDGV